MTETHSSDSPDRATAALATMLRALDRANIPVGVVRPPGRDGRGRLEADLAVARADRPAVEAELAEQGFRRRPGWGRRPHRFHVRPVLDEATSRCDWLKIDLVTEFRFGKWHELPGVSTSACLGARPPALVARQRLSPADEFAALMLHALLDRPELSNRHLAQLAALAPTVGAPGPLADRCVPPGATGPSWPDLLHAAVQQDTSLLAAYRPMLEQRLWRGNAAAIRWRRAANRLTRRATKVLTAVGARGALVAVIGPDGTGKTTLTATLAEDAGLPGRVLYGGTYPATLRRSTIPGLTTARVAGRLLMTRAQAAWHRSRGRLVVLDRHPLQVRPEADDVLSRRSRLRRSFLASLLPRPDLVVVLDAPVPVLSARRPDHRADSLARDRARHLRLVDHWPGLQVLDTDQPPAAVANAAVGLIWEHALTMTPGRRVAPAS